MNTQTVKNTSGGFIVSTTEAFCGFIVKLCETTMGRNIPWKSLESEQKQYHNIFPRGKRSLWMLFQVPFYWIAPIYETAGLVWF